MFAPKLSSQTLLIPLDLSEACVKVSLFFFKNYKLKAPIQDLARAVQNEYESMRTALHIHKQAFLLPIAFINRCLPAKTRKV